MRAATDPLPFLLLLFTLITACSDPNATDEKGRTALYYAAERGDRQQVGELIEAEANLSLADNCGWTPLLAASAQGHHEVVSQLLTAGADVNEADNGVYTALMLAAGNNHPKTVTLLLDNGADPTIADSTIGWTPLIWAAKEGHSRVIPLLAERAPLEQIDFNGDTALIWAIREGHYDAAEALLLAGAAPTATDKTGRTALVLAWQSGDPRLFDLLLRYTTQRQ